MNLDELYVHGQEAAKDLFEKQGSLSPMWLGIDKEGNLTPILIPMPDRELRDAVSLALRKTFKRMGVVRYVSMVEAWAVTGKKEELPESVMRGASLSTHPDRIEVIYIIAEDINGQHRSGMYHILRPEHGKATLSPFKDMGEDKHEGRFTNLLTPPSSSMN